MVSTRLNVRHNKATDYPSERPAESANHDSLEGETTEEQEEIEDYEPPRRTRICTSAPVDRKLAMKSAQRPTSANTGNQRSSRLALNAEAGPSRPQPLFLDPDERDGSLEAEHQSSDPLGRPGSSNDDSGAISETPRARSDNLAVPRAQPKARRVGTARATSRGKGVLAVEIPLLPLARVRRYIHRDSTLPTERSRQELLGRVCADDQDPEDATRLFPPQRSLRPRQPRQGPTWRVRSSPPVSGDALSEELGGYGTEDGDEEEEEDASASVSEDSDVVGLRRSGRRIAAAGRPGRETRATRMAVAKKRGRSESPRSSKLSSVSENTFYGSSARSHGRMPSDRPRGPARRYAEDDDEVSESSDDEDTRARRPGKRRTLAPESAGEDVLEDDDYELEDESDSSEMSGKAKEKGKQAQGRIDDDVLTLHRPFCERCLRGHADEMLEKAKTKKKKPRRRKKDDDAMSDTELAVQLEGWLECRKCCVASHWDCLGIAQKKAVLDDLLDLEGPAPPGHLKRKSVLIDEAFTFLCARCTGAPSCMECHHEKLVSLREGALKDQTIGTMEENGQAEKEEEEENNALLFRCLRCKQACHYEHLKNPFVVGKSRLPDIAYQYQHNTEKNGDAWLCHQCRDWVWKVDLVLAWRPHPANAVEAKRAPGELPSFKDRLPREYLVRWAGRGFRHATWVPHAWLQVIGPQRLRIFLEKGPSLDLVTDETLAAKGDDMAAPTIADVLNEDDRIKGKLKHHHSTETGEWEGHGPPPDPDAVASIPIEWSTVDRVLDVMLLPSKSSAKKQKSQFKRGARILSESPSETSRHSSVALAHSRQDGIEPPAAEQMDIDDWEKQTGRILSDSDVDEVAGLVTWCFVKWDDLQYDQSTWDTPPPVKSSMYPAFKRALSRYLGARLVQIPVLSGPEARKRDKISDKPFSPPEEQPDCVTGGQLMPFQMDGFGWLLYKHVKRESCILADDMGLGKTIQIASFLGYLGSAAMDNIYPCLVIVPNSTITNWVREFEKWVPHMRVVPFYGEAASRKIISKYELYHKGMQGKAAGLKAHVVLTTYDMITGSDFVTFKNIPRWEVLCVDEGQRLKSDTNLIFRKLKTLNSVHRILLTGTPLNNNLRELFNLLNFLDPEAFSDLAALEDRFAEENLNDALIQELHDMIKPYILRRIKADVLKLPPKIEIIVPISLSPLQKHVYKNILERNADVLKAIAESRRKRTVNPKASQAKGTPLREGANPVTQVLQATAPGSGSGVITVMGGKEV